MKMRGSNLIFVPGVEPVRIRVRSLSAPPTLFGPFPEELRESGIEATMRADNVLAVNGGSSDHSIGKIKLVNIAEDDDTNDEASLDISLRSTDVNGRASLGSSPRSTDVNGGSLVQSVLNMMLDDDEPGDADVKASERCLTSINGETLNPSLIKMLDNANEEEAAHVTAYMTANEEVALLETGNAASAGGAAPTAKPNMVYTNKFMDIDCTQLEAELNVVNEKSPTYFDYIKKKALTIMTAVTKTAGDLDTAKIDHI